MAARMKIGTLLCIVAVGLLAMGIFAGEAQAQCRGWGGGFYAYSGGGTYVGQHIPYYSLHPPVYYSMPVARPYGWSPFSWQSLHICPQMLRPAVHRVPPQVIRNPYVCDDVEVDLSVTQPLRIVNPYVKASPPDNGIEASDADSAGEDAVRGVEPLAIRPTTDLAQLP